MDKLELNLDKGLIDRSNPNAAYFKIVFTSPHTDHRFFVQHLGAVPASQIAYYVLARSPYDNGVYVRSAR